MAVMLTLAGVCYALDTGAMHWTLVLINAHINLHLR